MTSFIRNFTTFIDCSRKKQEKCEDCPHLSFTNSIKKQHLDKKKEKFEVKHQNINTREAELCTICEFKKS